MIVVAACFRLETAWIPKARGVRVVRIRPGAAGFAPKGGRPELLVSTGFCGGLDPRLETGGLILATEILHRGRTIKVSPELLARAQAALARAGIAAESGPILTAERVIKTVKDKSRLREETAALGVEMEAGRLADWAEETGVPFLAVKAVLDPAGVGLPLTAPREALFHPIAALRAGIGAVRAGRAIGRGIGAIIAGLGGGR